MHVPEGKILSAFYVPLPPRLYLTASPLKPPVGRSLAVNTHLKPKGKNSMLRKMLRKVSVASLFLFFSVFALARAKSRHFELDYSFTVRITDPGKPLDVWFPIAQSDQFQQVRIVSKSGDLPVKETSESEY